MNINNALHVESQALWHVDASFYVTHVLMIRNDMMMMMMMMQQGGFCHFDSEGGDVAKLANRIMMD